MIFKNCEAQFPEFGEFTDDDNALLNLANEALVKTRDLLEEQKFHRALETIWAVVGEANRYVDAQAPWALRKTDTDRMKTVLYILSDTIRKLALLTRPFMPQSSDKMLDILQVSANQRNYDAFDIALVSGTSIEKPSGIFPRFVAAEEEGA